MILACLLKPLIKKSTPTRFAVQFSSDAQAHLSLHCSCIYHLHVQKLLF